MNPTGIKIGVIADTHVPDKAKALNPRVLPLLRQSGVGAIVHAGDICSPGVLAKLGEIAPVHAVRGNRDWVLLGHLPLHRTLTFEGVTLGLTHSHGGLRQYIIGKFHYISEGYQFQRIKTRLLETFPGAKVIVFGHTHRPVNDWVDGTLFFNPGSAIASDKRDLPPSLGILHIQLGGQVTGEILPLV